MVDRRRKWRAEKQNISIKTNIEGDEYIVSGASGTDYRVDLTKPFCECPDWKKRKPEGGCKHILKIKLNKGMIDSVASAHTNLGNPQNRSRSNYSSNWTELARRSKKRDNWTCQKCGTKGGSLGSAQLHAHHIKAKKHGGKDNIDNLITVCHSCHEEEHGHSIPEGSETKSTPATSSTASADSKVDETRSQYKGSPTGYSKTRNTSSRNTSDSCSSTSGQATTISSSNDSSTTSSIYSNILPMDADIKNKQYTHLTALRWDFISALLVMFAGAGIGLIISFRLIVWIIILTIAAIFFISFRYRSANIKSTVNDIERKHEEFEKQFRQLQDQLGSERYIEEKQLRNIHQTLLDIEQNIDEVEDVVSDEYVEWVSETKQLFKSLT